MYDYRDAVKEDVKQYIIDNYDKEEYEDLDYNTLYDEMFIEDSITGNASGSYTFNSYEAEENISHNLDLAQEAYEYFGYEGVDMSKGAEAIDVTIRCYLLSDVLYEVLQELENEYE